MLTLLTNIRETKENQSDRGDACFISELKIRMALSREEDFRVLNRYLKFLEVLFRDYSFAVSPNWENPNVRTFVNGVLLVDVIGLANAIGLWSRRQRSQGARQCKDSVRSCWTNGFKERMRFETVCYCGVDLHSR